MRLGAFVRGLMFCAALGTFVPTAGAATIGQPADPATGNCFPFGCVGLAGNPSDRYQQVYDSSEFGSTILIELIDFFQTQAPGGVLNFGLYTIRLSTTSATVNGLDTVNFDNNLGGDVAIFAQDVALADVSTGSGLQFTGSGFFYDPTQGNLLVDIQIANVQHFGGIALFDARTGTATGEFSRAHNFSGSGFLDSGLVTAFNPIPEPGTAGMLALGLTALAAVRRRGRR